MKFDQVLDFFFQNSIVCRVFFKNLIFQFSILCRIHFCFSSPTKRQRQRDLVVFFFSLILCAYNLTVPQQRKKKRKDRRRTGETTTTDITITRFIHTLSLLTFDLKTERVHTKNDLSRFFGHASARNRHGSQALTHVFFWGGRSCRCPCSEIATTWPRERRTRDTL